MIREFNLQATQCRVRRIFKKRTIRFLRELLLPITALLTSIITIFLAWFMRTGAFQFIASSWLDWTILIVLVFITFNGFIFLTSTLQQKQIKVTRSELSDIISVVRSEADFSVINISGDLSWLKDDYYYLLAIKKSKPDLRIKIFCDRSGIPLESIEMVKELNSHGIEFFSYPFSISPFLKCIFVDRSNLENRRLYTIAHHRSPKMGEPREQHPFILKEYGPEPSFEIESINALITTLESIQRSPMKVGISGVNNVGKTRIATKLRDCLSKKFKVQFFADQFFLSGNGTNIKDNFIILCSQLLAKEDPNVDICIYDRTLVDNLCFMMLRDKDDRLYRELLSLFAQTVKNYELIVDVHRADDDYSTDTKLLKGSDRICIRKSLDSFFQTYDLQKLDVFTDTKNLEQSINQAVVMLYNRISSIYAQRMGTS